MNKKIEDYLPYYIGQEVKFEFTTITGRKENRVGALISFTMPGFVEIELHGYHKRTSSSVKLRLRPLSDMTREEMTELHILFFDPSSRDIYTQKIKEIIFYKDEPKRITKHGSGVGYTTFDENQDHVSSGTLSLSRFNANQFHYLLKQGFDLFGLIEAGLAVDKTLLFTTITANHILLQCLTPLFVAWHLAQLFF